ncbi:serine hydrolase [Rhodobacteraceae bacterium NNCM2]|nr:serine hydrolase [Coraliihabitans acroporae]
MTSFRNSETAPPIMQGTPPPPEWRPPRDAWDRAPWNRWSFHHIRELLPTVEVWRGTGPVQDLPASHQDIGEIPFTGHDGTVRTVARMLEDTYTDGFILIHRGRVIHESYYGTMGPRALHLSQSVAKSITAAACGVMIADGRLDPEAPLADLMPELGPTAYADATIRHLLDMASGVRFDETYTDPASDMGKLDVATGWKSPPEGAEGWPMAVWDQILTLTEKEAPHGSRFLYRSIETDVIAHAMERAAGKRLAGIISETLWQRLGVEESACFTVDPAGYALADGGFNAVLRDYARFGLAMLNGGRVGGQQVIPAAFVEDTMRAPRGMFNEAGRASLPNGTYRNQFWIEDRVRATILARGVFGQLIFISPELETVAVKLSSWPDFLNPGFDIDTRRAIRAVAETLA